MRAYHMRLRVAESAEVGALVDALLQQECAVRRQGSVVSLLWPESEADDPDEWDERTFVELVFFLRAWSGNDPRRHLMVIEEGPVEVPEEVFRLAS